MKSIAQRDRSVNRSCVRTSGSGGVSASLIAANAHLSERRRLHNQAKQPKPVSTNGGWGLARLSALVEQDTEQRFNPPSEPQAPISAEKPTISQTNNSVRVSAEIATAMLKSELAAVGRVWLLCRHVDGAGRGWLPVDTVRQRLTSKHSPLRLFGWRRLRAILKQGSGIFWQRDDAGRLWLFSRQRVAKKLGVARLGKLTVELPVARLCGTIQETRALLYATSHVQPGGGGPISRATLTKTTGVKARTQRTYDSLAGISAESCYAVGEQLVAGETPSYLYERGGGSFKFTDKLGKQGQAGLQYAAWRLPNCYSVALKTNNLGRRRKINRWLQSTDLVKQRAQGNGDMKRQKVFYENAGEIRPNKNDECYWFDKQVGVWHPLRVGVK